MKKEWTKPKLIALYRGRPEEAVLGTCKTIAENVGGPTSGQSCVGQGECFDAAQS